MAPLTRASPSRDNSSGLLEYVSPTRLNTWLTCPLKFRLRYVDGIEEPTPPSLFLGKRVHNGLEFFYRHRQNGRHLSAVVTGLFSCAHLNHSNRWRIAMNQRDKNKSGQKAESERLQLAKDLALLAVEFIRRARPTKDNSSNVSRIYLAITAARRELPIQPRVTSVQGNPTMLDSRQLASIRAALRYWQDEMAPHGPDIAHHYFSESDESPLSPEEVADLIVTLESCVIRPIKIDPETGRIWQDDVSMGEISSRGRTLEGIILWPGSQAG